MSTTFFIIIIMLDLLLFYGMFYIYKKKIAASELLAEVTEERQQIRRLSSEIKQELFESQRKSQRVINEVKQIASETQNEISVSKETLEKKIAEIYGDLTKELSTPMEEVVIKQNALQHLLKKVEREKENLNQVIEKSSKILSFFNEQVPYEKILEDIEDKKYLDTRRLLVQGVEPQKVAEQVGLSITEVELVKNLSS